VNSTTWTYISALNDQYLWSPFFPVQFAATADGRLHLFYVQKSTGTPFDIIYNGTSWSSNQLQWCQTSSPLSTSIQACGNDVFLVKEDEVEYGYLDFRQYDAAPSTPQSLSASLNSSNQVVVSWAQNPEPDVASGGGYNIYKAVYYSGGSLTYTKLNSSLLTSPTYTDNSAPPSGLPNGADVYYRYYVTATDYNSHTSSATSDYWYYVGHTVSGTISSNTTYNGTYLVTASLTVNSGSTLSISSGSSLRFMSGTSLTCNGELSTSSTVSFSPVSGTSSGSWGPLKLNGSGANYSTISNANITYGTEVDVYNASDVTIQNCSITKSSSTGIYAYEVSGCLFQNNTIANSNAYHGIYMNGGSSNNCYDNVIYHYYNVSPGYHNGFGILYSGCSGNVWQNDIRGMNQGFGAIWGASPLWRNPDNESGATRNNRITDCSTAAVIYEVSYPELGEPDPTYGSSSIYSNSVDIALNTSYSTESNLDADGIYWTNGNPAYATFQIGSGSAIYDSPYSSTNEWSGYSLPDDKSMPVMVVASAGKSPNSVKEVQTASVNVSANPVSPSLPPFFDGIQLLGQKEYKEAKDFFISYLSNHPDDQAAYVELYNCYSPETASDLITYFKALPAAAANEHKLLLANLYLMQGDVTSAKGVNQQIVDDNPNTSLGVKAMLNNFYIALNMENDPTNATNILNEVKSKSALSTSWEIADAEHDLGVKSPEPNASGSVGSNGVSSDVSDASTLQNYPNPFNPTTKIDYRVTTAGQVTLKVYDILGREVATLVNTNEQQGNYSTQFDGSRLSSGIYFYILKTADKTEIQKMLLMK
jgi:Secretion system C-terminal sorting domain/Right handed beta helix region